jgi:hypothetical protein
MLLFPHKRWNRSKGPSFSVRRQTPLDGTISVDDYTCFKTKMLSAVAHCMEGTARMEEHNPSIARLELTGKLSECGKAVLIEIRFTCDRRQT